MISIYILYAPRDFKYFILCINPKPSINPLNLYISDNTMSGTIRTGQTIGANCSQTNDSFKIQSNSVYNFYSGYNYYYNC